MAISTTQSPYERFQALLMPNPNVDRDAYDRVQAPGALHDASLAYQKALEGGNLEALRGEVYNLASRLAQDESLAGYNIRPEDIRDDFARQTTSRFEQPGESQQSTQPTTGTPLFGRPKSPNNTSGGGGTSSEKPDVLKKIQSIQEEKLLQQFDAIIANTTATEKDREEAIERLFSNIDAQHLLRDQYDLVHRHLLQTEAIKKNGAEGDPLSKKIQQQLEKHTQELLSQSQLLPKGEHHPESIFERNIRQALLDKSGTGVNSARGQLRDLLKYRQSTIGKRALSVVGLFETQYPSVGSEIFLTQLYESLVAAGIAGQMQTGAVGMQLLSAQTEQEAAENSARQNEEDNVQQQNATFQNQQQKRKGGGQLGKTARKEAGKLAKEGLKQLEKTAAKEAAGTAARTFLGLTWEFWGPFLGIAILLVVVVAILMLVVFIVVRQFFSSSTQSQPAAIQSLCNPSNTCEGALKQTFGITLTGDLALYRDPYGKAKLIYDTLSLISQPPSKFSALLGLPRNPITINLPSGGCVGHASGNGVVNLWGFGACGTSVARFMLIHELSHEIAFRNPSLYQRYLNEFTFSRLIQYHLPTYNCEFDYGIGPFTAECFADTVGEYVTYKYYRNTVSGRPSYFESVFSSFPTLYAPFYNFAKDNIFMGVEF